MNQLQPSELVQSFSFADHPFPVFLINRNSAFPTQDGYEIPDASWLANFLSASKPALTGEEDKAMTSVVLADVNHRQWLIEPGTVSTVPKIKQPGFGTADQGGSYD